MFPRAREAAGGPAWLGNVVVIAPFWERKGSSLNAPVPFHGSGALPIQLQLTPKRAKEEGVRVVLEIDLALWGMIACLAMKVAQYSF